MIRTLAALRAMHASVTRRFADPDDDAQEADAHDVRVSLYEARRNALSPLGPGDRPGVCEDVRHHLDQAALRRPDRRRPRPGESALDAWLFTSDRTPVQVLALLSEAIESARHAAHAPSSPETSAL